MTTTPSYGTYVNATSPNGVSYKGWFIRINPATHFARPNQIVMIEDDSTSQRYNPFALPTGTVLEPVTDPVEIKEMPSAAHTVATYSTSYNEERSRGHKLEDELTTLREQNTLSLTQLAQDREELGNLKAKVKEIFRIAAARGYQNEASSLAAQVGLDIPTEEEFEIQVTVIGHTTVTKVGYSLEDAVSSLTDEDVKQSVLAGGTLESFSVKG